MWWREPVTSLKGIGIKKALEFQKLNIETVGDLLNRFPRMDSYLDYSKVKRIGELTTDNEKQLFTGEVFRVSDKYSGRGKRYTVITVQDAAVQRQNLFPKRLFKLPTVMKVSML